MWHTAGDKLGDESINASSLAPDYTLNLIAWFGSPDSEWASLVAQMVKNLPAMQETLTQSLGWEDPL